MCRIITLFIIISLILGCAPTRFNGFYLNGTTEYFKISDSWYGNIQLYSEEHHEIGFKLRREPIHSAYLILFTNREIKNDFKNNRIYIDNFQMSYNYQNKQIRRKVGEASVYCDGDPYDNELIEYGIFPNYNKTTYLSVLYYDIYIPFEVKEVLIEFDLIDNDKVFHAKVPLYRKSSIKLWLQVGA